MSETKSSMLLLETTPELRDGWGGPAVFHIQEPTTGGDVERVGWWVGDTGYWIEPDGETLCEYTGDDPDQEVYLDLARTECRDRVARVLGRPARERLEPKYTSAHYMVAPSGVARLHYFHEIPAFADLDPNDDTRLPDGSRLVDAQALHAVATEVLHSE